MDRQHVTAADALTDLARQLRNAAQRATRRGATDAAQAYRYAAAMARDAAREVAR